jgi:hypothetical protein
MWERVDRNFPKIDLHETEQARTLEKQRVKEIYISAV